MTISAVIIAHSKNQNGEELVTFEIETYRYILAEINTHKALSRNYQSSRAIKLSRQRKIIMDNMAVPIQWGSNNPGMESNSDLIGVRRWLAKKIWRSAGIFAVAHHKLLDMVGLHKQWTNRIIEPYMYTRGVITCNVTELRKIFKLRLHPSAQPEFRELCADMDRVLGESTPLDLKPGEWHIPYCRCWRDSNGKLIYIICDKIYTMESIIKISISLVAQVSYRNQDSTLEKAESILKRLNIDSDENPHISPTEHIAIAVYGDAKHANFRGFKNYRTILEEGVL